jgi:hypothetical protein
MGVSVPALDAALGPDEELLFRTRLHPAVFSGAASFAACVFGVAALVVARNELSGETIRTLWLSAAVLALLGFIGPFLRWRTTELAVTARRVIAQVGTWRRRVVEMPLSHLDDLAVDDTLGGRLLGYGTVQLVGTDGSVATVPRVAEARALYAAASRRARTGRPATGR